MKLQKWTLHILPGLICSLLLPIIIYILLHFKPTLTPAENAVLEFPHPSYTLSPRVWRGALNQSPVNATSRQSDQTAITATELLPPPPTENDLRVSFILHGTGKNLAIINGNVLKEGNTFNGWRVIRIEQNRLLIAGKKGKKWLTLN